MGAWIGDVTVDANYSGYTQFLDSCKAERFTPLVQMWYFGDEISPTHIKNGSPSERTRTKAFTLAQKLAEKAESRGLSPFFVIEAEWNKEGIQTWTNDTDPLYPNGWNSYYLDIRNQLRTYNPSCKIVYAPGNYRDLTPEADRFAAAIDNSDWLAIAGTIFNVVRPAEGWNLSRYQNSWDYLFNGIDEIRAATAPVDVTKKPFMISDLGYSTYGTVAGTHFETTHPFAPIAPETQATNGRRLDSDQQSAFQGLKARAASFESRNLRIYCYREWDDDWDRQLTDYFGYAERHWGIRQASCYLGEC